MNKSSKDKCKPYYRKWTVHMGYRTSARSRNLDIGTFMERHGVKVHKLAKKATRAITSHPDRTSLVYKGFTDGFHGNFSCGTQRVVPSGKDNAILPPRVANHRARSGLSCLLTELAIL